MFYDISVDHPWYALGCVYQDASYSKYNHLIFDNPSNMKVYSTRYGFKLSSVRIEYIYRPRAKLLQCIRKSIGPAI